MIAFVRLVLFANIVMYSLNSRPFRIRMDTRPAAEEVIERLHGRVVRGWNDNGCRISVRFADTNEQRELRVIFFHISLLIYSLPLHSARNDCLEGKTKMLAEQVACLWHTQL